MRMTVSGRFLVAMLLALGVSSEAIWAKDVVRQHGAHEHGVGLVNIAKVDSDLLIELEIPALHVVGFEKLPQTDEERELAALAVRLFEDPQKLFTPSNDAGCAVQDVHAQLWDEAANVEHSGHTEKDKHSEHEDEKHSEHDDEQHASLTASYTYRCDAPKALKVVSTKVFEHLTGVGTLRVQIVTTAGQTRLTLTPTSPDIVLAE
ncbi:MAG: DUF2796 domain-containing protein [Chromatiales bacterium]|jgi:hypothetical protein|nr:DUF2796 domain-containing protein [Chromatiales bacterium]